MRIAIYILSLVFSAALFIFSAFGSLGTAVSYKYEVEDPSVEIGIDHLPLSERKIAYEHLAARKNELELQDYLFTGLLILSMGCIVLLLIYRKRILGKKPVKEL